MAPQGERTGPEQLGILIKETQAVLHQRMDEALRPMGLSVPQYVCLQTLHDSPGITSAELARRGFVSRQSMNVLLQALEKRGLVERAGEPGPRRERAAELTAEAFAIVARARATVAAVVATMTDALDAGRQDELARLLVLCRDALLARSDGVGA